MAPITLPGKKNKQIEKGVCESAVSGCACCRMGGATEKAGLVTREVVVKAPVIDK